MYAIDKLKIKDKCIFIEHMDVIKWSYAMDVNLLLMKENSKSIHNSA